MLFREGSPASPDAKPFFFRSGGSPGRSGTWLKWGLRLSLGVSFSLAGIACAFPEDQFYSTREANERVMLVFLLKDNECGTAHAVTVPILAPVHEDELDACVIGIIDATCLNWAKNDPVPNACRTLQVRLLR